MVAKLVDEARQDVPDGHVVEIDITERPELAVKYGVMATPAIAINGRLEFSGIPREEALRARLRVAARGGARR